jgi:dihydrodipicolinate synthase/N-acetylneuraminate lyase
MLLEKPSGMTSSRRAFDNVLCYRSQANADAKTQPMMSIRAGRRVDGIAAVLLPFDGARSVDWRAFDTLVTRTAAAGIRPAVNMDTGYVQLLGPDDRTRALERARKLVGSELVAGVVVDDRPGDAFQLDAYLRAADAVARCGATPVIFPSFGLSGLSEERWVAALAAIGERCGPFIAFELGPMFVPYGRIYSLEAYAALLEVPHCIGAKHSSLSRNAEWDRLRLRDERRPAFRVYTGNDRAIDMIMYGSDYLLGLAGFCPDAFALRDRYWCERDARFFELNDLLQYLGQFSFRDPVPAYRHDAAMFLALRGWIASDATPPGAQRRPEADRDVLAELLHRIEALL